MKRILSSEHPGGNPAAANYNTYVANPWFDLSPYRQQERRPSQGEPSFSACRDKLPAPFWDGGERELAAYWGAWKIAFDKIKPATEANGFAADYADTAFNDCTFMWDSAFITMFWRYGARAWNAMGTLDNFYIKQHSDGFICREISWVDGADHFQRHDPNSTGPNVLPWAEWEYYLNSGDRGRLARVFPALAAYTRWLRRNRTWPDGSHWATGWASGMDNQPRRPDAFLKSPPSGTDGFHVNFDHGHMSWVDACLQAVFANRLLVAMAGELGMADQVEEFRREAEFLSQWCDANLWNEESGFYHDRLRDGSLAASVKSIGAYWALLADVAPPRKLPRLVAHLRDPKAFNRAHRLPSLSADTQGYDPDGGYWLGAVWAPTNYMVLRGLSKIGEDRLAHEIGLNHVRNVAAAHAETGTFFENYAPDFEGAGRFRRDFVGWTGVPPVTVLFEYVFGLRPNVPAGELLWDVQLTDAHGVEKYPFGLNGELNLRCHSRGKTEAEPQIEANSNIPLKLVVKWQGGMKTINVDQSPTNSQG